MTTFDAVVAGGSFAGACAAAALSRRGLQVLVCEPGLADHRRLAGELIQAPGAQALEELGLLDAAWAAGAVPSCGFAVLPGGSSPAVVLSYAETTGCHSTGIAIEHDVLARALLDRVATLPGVTVRQARVTNATGFDSASVKVEIDGTETIEAALVVAADGRGSKLREAAGISAQLGPRVRMSAVRVQGPLPHEGYGHVVLGGVAPVLAYRISRETVRVLFTALDEHARPFKKDIAALPGPLAEQVEHELSKRQVTSAVVFGLTPSQSSRGRLFLVGDSGGCVHPLTATGVSFCARDALRLESALVESNGDVLAASSRYHLGREAPLFTRSALGPLLAETLADSEPATSALRGGLIRYWRRDRNGRGASMGLLSTHDPRIGVLAREYVKVMGHAIIHIAGQPSSASARLALTARMLGKSGRVALRALAPSTFRERQSDASPP